MSTYPLADMEAEAIRLVDGLAEHGCLARLIGGLAIAQHRHGEVPSSLARKYYDIDIVVPARKTGPLHEGMERLGYTPNKRFNNLCGDKRMLFYDEPNGRQVDVFVRRFDMCHGLDLADRLDTGSRTLFPSDLLLTKLQVVQINRKDLIDALTLLLHHEVTATGADVVDLDRLISVTSSDWGWYTTLTDNLARIPDLANELLDTADAATVIDKVRTISNALETSPKSLRWKARAKIGRKLKWYELPEEVGQTIVTR